MRVSEDQVFDLLVELVEYSAERGLPRTATALEGVLDAFLQDRGLAPRALPAPEDVAVSTPLAAVEPPSGAGPEATVTGPEASAAALARAAAAPVRDALRAGDGADAAGIAAVAGFQSRRVPTMPRRLHLMPSQRVAV